MLDQFLLFKPSKDPFVLSAILEILQTSFLVPIVWGCYLTGSSISGWERFVLFYALVLLTLIYANLFWRAIIDMRNCFRLVGRRSE